MSIQTKLSSLAERILTKNINNSHYELAYRISKETPELVTKLLVSQPKIANSISDDYVLGSCLLFANMPTHYQIPFYRTLEKLQNATVCWSRQSGKTHNFGIGANLVALTRPNSVTLVISASMRQSMILRRKMNKPFNAMHASLKRLLYQDILKTSITTKVGGGVYFESCLSEDNLRGYSADLIMPDELTVWSNAEYVYEDILDPMLNTTNGAIMAAFTPKSKTGLAYKLATSKDFVHLHATWLDAVWAGVMKIERARKIKEKYESGEIGEATMQTEHWANFYDDVGRLLLYDAIMKCVTQDEQYKYYTANFVNNAYVQSMPKIRGRFFGGTDLGKIGDHTVICIIERVDNYRCVRHLHVFKLGTPGEEIIEYHKRLSQVFSIGAWRVDGTINSYLAEQIQKVTTACKIDIFSSKYKQETARMLSERVNQRELVLPLNMQNYYMALNSINRETLDTDNGEHSGNSDMFWSTCMAVRAETEFKHGIVR